MGPAAPRLLRGYYLATPAFLLIDALFGVNIRAAAFESHPLLKRAYYGGVLACAAAFWKKFRWSALAGLAESSVNLISLFVGFLAPYYRLAQAVSEERIAGSAAVIAFHSATSRLAVKHR